MNLYPGLQVMTTYEKVENQVGVVESVHRFSATITHPSDDPEQKARRSNHHYRWLQPMEK